MASHLGRARRRGPATPATAAPRPRLVAGPSRFRHARVWIRAPAPCSIDVLFNEPGGRPMYRLMGRTHAGLLQLRREHGQGTVEYVALILLVALVMAGVVAAMKGFRTDEGKELGDVIIGKIKEAVRKVQF
jgi:hypothetical protein